MSTTSTLRPIAATRSITAKLIWALPVLFGATIFTSACLLFLVQPLVSKMILPWFGGSAAVWITSMLFFQTSLLVGYLYAHFLTRVLKPSQQVMVHTALLALALSVLPIAPSARWLPKPGGDPTLAVFLVLGTCIGLPYTLLSATSPLLQKWFSDRYHDSLPYRYFALSNAGSMIALFSYPLLVEPQFTGHQQSWLWSAGFVLFVLLCASCALLQMKKPLARSTKISVEISESDARASLRMLSLWTALAACASALLLIVTNLLTQNIAPMPLLWVVPLGVYLLTFILCFDSSFWYRRWLFAPLVFPALGYLTTTTSAVQDKPLFKIAPLMILSLFVVCMACHGELAKLKPEPNLLTSFYVAVAVGGALGGVAIALIAPRIFNANYEYPIGLSLVAVVLLFPFWLESRTWTRPQIGMSVWLAAAASCIVLAGFAAKEFRADQKQAMYLARNFYGTLRIDEFRDGLHHHIRQLNHGTITHGRQILDFPMRQVATTYYGRESGIGLTWRTIERSGPITMGVIGLGTGTLASYGRAGDSLHFYEINPLVVEIAQNRFTYLSDSAAHIDLSLGDARLVLERQAPQHFDILVVDAFSGDAIPVHLLTQEAFRVYLKHLKSNGVLAVHVSNRFLDLAPIVAAAARNADLEARIITNEDDDSYAVFQSDWVLLTNRKGFFKSPLLDTQVNTIPLSPNIRAWTDDYSNLWKVLRVDD